MKHIIKKTESKFVKEVIDSFEVELPEKQIFLFETGIRRSLSIRPLWTTWERERGKDEFIHSLEIVCVYQSGRTAIEFHTIQVSRIEDIISSPTESKTVEGRLIDYILLHPEWHSIRTEGQFIDDFNGAIDRMKDSIYAATPRYEE